MSRRPTVPALTGGSWTPPLLICLGLTLLAVSWLFSNPPGSAPDEPAHYIRAVSVGQFEWLGQPTSQTVMRAENPRQQKLLNSIARLVVMPARLAAPDAWYCTVVDHDASAACVERSPRSAPASSQSTYVGSYAPFAYLPYGLATRLGRDPVSALLWARLAGAAIALAFISGAVLLLWEPGAPTSLIGLTTAVTPMVVFTSVVVSTSSIEVAGSLGLAAAAVRLWRSPESSFAVYLAGISAIVVGIARPFGPIWVLSGALLLSLLLRREGLTRLARATTPAVVVMGAAVTLGVALNVAWQTTVLPPGPRPLGDIVGFLGPSLGSLSTAFGEAIGFFGWQDVLMPWPAYAAWGLAFVGLLATALVVGRRRELRALEATLAGALLVVIGLSAAVVLPTGYAVRGRYVLPALAAICLVAGEVIHRNRGRLGGSTVRIIALGLTAIAAGLQLVGWYSMAHRYAVGTAGSWWFLGNPQWQPSLGWGTWLCVVILGALSLVAGGLLSFSRSTRNAVAPSPA